MDEQPLRPQWHPSLAQKGGNTCPGTASHKRLSGKYNSGYGYGGKQPRLRRENEVTALCMLGDGMTTHAQYGAPGDLLAAAHIDSSIDIWCV